MELSELEKIIIGGLKLCGMRPDDVVAIMFLLKTEEQHWEMADYLEVVLENPPDRADVLQKAVEIAQKTADLEPIE